MTLRFQTCLANLLALLAAALLTLAPLSANPAPGNLPFVSNKIHPYFVQTTRAVVNSEGHVYSGPIEHGNWVDAANLQAGDRLLNDDGSWAEVVSVKVEETPLTAYNLTVEDFHTYFVAANENAAPVWVHNDCFDDLTGSLGNMSRSEFKALTAKWGQGTFGSLADSLKYHANKHWGGNVESYLRAASNFSTKGAKSTGLRADGSIRYTKNGFFAVYKNGKMVTFGKQ